MLIQKLPLDATAYKDVDGRHECKDEDPVALVKIMGAPDLMQPNLPSRPILRDGWMYFDGIDDSLSSV